MRLKLLLVALFIGGLATDEGIAFATENPQQRAVLVTGASSGIGLSIARKLAANGFYVYAGARKPADLERLDAMDNVSSVRLDVTVQEDIDNAVEFVKRQGRGLYGVVNNAGVGSFASLVDGPEWDLDFVFNVNVYGPYRINKAFLPMLIESNGRTTTIGSVAGVVAGRNGIYSMSKFAIEAYTDSLALELEGTGVHVSVVEPGGFKSSFRANRAARALAAAEKGEVVLSDAQRRRYETSETREATIKDPDEVAEAVLELMSSDDLKRRYMVTPNERAAHAAIRKTLLRTLQLNEDQPYSLDRDQIVAMLDELLAAQ